MTEPAQHAEDVREHDRSLIGSGSDYERRSYAPRWRRLVVQDWWHRQCKCRCQRWYGRRCGPCWCGR